MQVRPLIGTVGDAYDNATAASRFASLEGELIARNRFKSKAQARMAVFSPGLPPRGLGYLSPLNFERSEQALFDVVEDVNVHEQTMSKTV